MKGMTIEELGRRVHAASGSDECDLALTNVQVVDVFNMEIVPDATVLVSRGRVAAVLRNATDIRAGRVVDCGGKYLLPGLMDAHVHIESSMLTPAEFAAAVLPCGTTRVVADPHEIANVGGTAGLRYMYDASEGLPLHVHFALPSCVPCTPFEDGGASLSAGDLEPFFHRKSTVSLGEVMNYPGVLGCNSDLLAKIRDARNAGCAVDGHSPGLSGRDLQAYAACGIGNDHECSSVEEMKERIACGMSVFIREGSAARNLETLIGGVTPASACRCCFCTDDLHAEDILARGHINAILAKAVSLGLPAPLAVSMATINPARSFGLSGVGAIAPGYTADLCLADDLKDFHITSVWSEGRLVVEDGQLCEQPEQVVVPDSLLSSVHLAKFSRESLRLAVPSGRARVMGMLPHSLITEHLIMDVQTKDGCFDAADNPGLCKICVVERHKNLGLAGLGILSGYVRKDEHLDGAIAVSVAHDSHNIVCAGDSDADMELAIQTVASLNGGIALVRQGAVVAKLALPVAGLMSLHSADTVARMRAEVSRAAAGFAVSSDVDAVMSLSFMSLCVIPSLRVNTRGLFDVEKFCFIPIDAEEPIPGKAD